MKFLFLILTFAMVKILFSSEMRQNKPIYSVDYTTGNLIEVIDNTDRDNRKFYQKVVLDHDGVYRLKTFKKNSATTPVVLKNMVNLESELSTVSKIELERKKDYISKSL